MMLYHHEHRSSLDLHQIQHDKRFLHHNIRIIVHHQFVHRHRFFPSSLSILASSPSLINVIVDHHNHLYLHRCFVNSLCMNASSLISHHHHHHHRVHECTVTDFTSASSSSSCAWMHRYWFCILVINVWMNASSPISHHNRFVHECINIDFTSSSSSLVYHLRISLTSICAWM